MGQALQSDRPYTIPDFESDERVRAAYLSVSRRLINGAVAGGLEPVRAEFEAIALRLTLRAREAGVAQRAAATAAHRARVKYAGVVPRERTASGIVRPPRFFFDQVVSMGAAGALYDEAVATARAGRAADAAARDAVATLEHLQTQARAAIAARELDIRRHFRTAHGRRELDADPRLRGLAQQCADIEAERADFQARLDRGGVSDEELRDRTMAREGSRFLDGDVRGLRAVRARDVRFGRMRYFTFRDESGRFWLLDYREDLPLLLELTFDVVFANDRYLVARSSGGVTHAAAQRGDEHRPAADPRARSGVDPRLMRALVDFAGRERATI